jgi:hypothetical protein
LRLAVLQLAISPLLATLSSIEVELAK